MKKVFLVLLLASLLGWVSPAHGQAAIAQATTWVHCSACGTALHTAAFGSSVTAGNYVVVVASGVTPQPTLSLTGAGCSGATLTSYVATWNSNFGATFGVSTSVAGGACTIGCQSATSGNYNCIGLEISGSNGTVDGTPGFNEQNATTSASSSTTTTQANDLLIAIGNNGPGSTQPSPTAPFTAGTGTGNFPASKYGFYSDPSIGSQSVTFTVGSSSNLTVGVLALESSGGGGGGGLTCFPTLETLGVAQCHG